MEKKTWNNEVGCIRILDYYRMKNKNKRYKIVGKVAKSHLRIVETD